jgi:hypothetical protein
VIGGQGRDCRRFADQAVLHELVAIRACSGQRQLHTAVTKAGFAARTTRALAAGMHSRDWVLDVPSSFPRAWSASCAARDPDELVFGETVGIPPSDVQIGPPIAPPGSDVCLTGVHYRAVFHDADRACDISDEFVVLRRNPCLGQGFSERFGGSLFSCGHDARIGVAFEPCVQVADQRASHMIAESRPKWPPLSRVSIRRAVSSSPSGLLRSGPARSSSPTMSARRSGRRSAHGGGPWPRRPAPTRGTFHPARATRRSA